MKWKNIDIGAAYCYITGAFEEWLPLLNNANGRAQYAVWKEQVRALAICSEKNR